MTEQETWTENNQDKAPTVGRPPAAALIRRDLAHVSLLAVRLIGPPGSGKTELIEATLKHMATPRRVAVIVINPAAGRDVQRLRDHCGYIEAIDAAVPTASAVRQAVLQIPLLHVDTLLIEACGGLAPLADLGQDATVAAFATSGGDDKAAEYATLLRSSSAVVLTKMDLRTLVNFDTQLFHKDVQTINPSAKVFELSSRTGSGLMPWLDWLEALRAFKKSRRNAARPGGDRCSTDTFLG